MTPDAPIADGFGLTDEDRKRELAAIAQVRRVP